MRQIEGTSLCKRKAEVLQEQEERDIREEPEHSRHHGSTPDTQEHDSTPHSP